MKTMMKGIAVAAVSLALVGAAQAGTTTITFDGIAAPGSFVGYGNGPLTLSGVTFTANGSMFIIDPGFYSSSYPGGGFLNVDYAGTTNTLTIALPRPTTSVTFDFGGLFNGPVTFVTTVPSHGFSTMVTTLQSITGDASLASAGVTSSTPFSLLTITMPDAPNYNAIDNFTFTTVPEPTAWIMMLAGFSAAGAVLRRQRASFV